MVNANYIYKLPFFAKSNGLIHSILGGWEFAGTFIDEAGIPGNWRCGPTRDRPLDQLRSGRLGGKLHQPSERQRQDELPEDTEAVVQHLPVLGS